ncbi:MAG: glycosyltransferase family 39 protein [bacterium]
MKPPMPEMNKSPLINEFSQKRKAPLFPGTEHPLRKADAFLLAAITIAALIVRTGFVIKAEPMLFRDMEIYVFISQSLAAGNLTDAIHFHYPPLFPTLFAPVGLILEDFESGCRVVSVLLGACVVVPVYLLAFKTAGRGAAILASSFYAFVFFIGGQEQEQALIFFVWTAVLAALLSLEKKKAGWFLATGVLFGLAFLTKPEGWGFFLAFLGLAFCYWLFNAFRYGDPDKAARWAKQRFPGKYGLLCIALLAAGYFMITSPYLFAYYQRTGEVTMNPKARSLLYLHNLRDYSMLYMIQKDPAGYYTLAQRMYLEGDVNPPEESIYYLLYKHRKQFVSVWWARFKIAIFDTLPNKYLQRIAPGIWPVLLLLGLWNRRRKLLPDLYIHALALVPLILVPFFTSVFPRFYFSLLPWFMIFLGRGTWRAIAIIAWLFSKTGVGKDRLKLYFTLASLAVLIYLCTTKIAFSSPPPHKKMKLEFRKEIASELKSMLPEECRFMAELGRPSMWYMAGFHPARQEVLPSDDLNKILVYALRKDVKFIVHHEHPARHKRYITLDPLLRKDFSYPPMKRRLRRTSPLGKVYVIYEVVPVKCGADKK